MCLFSRNRKKQCFCDESQPTPATLVATTVAASLLLLLLLLLLLAKQSNWSYGICHTALKN